MKVMAFNGSPHTDGAVAKGISIMADELGKAGIEVEIAHIGHRQIPGCIGCMECWKLGNGCTVIGDPVLWAHEKVKTADGIILGSPVYLGGVAGTFKSFLDRLFFSGSKDMSHKIGATVVSLRRTGGISVFHQLNNYFNFAQMVITPSVYWSVVHGSNADEMERDLEGVQTLEAQARNMAWLIKALAAGKKEEPPPPPPAKRVFTNFIR